MKTSLLLLPLLLLSVGAFGQCCQTSGVQPQMSTPWMVPDHAMRASQHGLGIEYDLQERGGSTMARGERPAWEVYDANEVSLGDFAREYRKQHLTARKALFVWDGRKLK